MRTIEEYARVARAERLARLARTAEELAAAIAGQADHALARRPDDRNWAPTEVLCHLRDVEESFLDRLRQIMLMDEPRFPRVNPDRWATERQYLASAPIPALAAFRRRRAETLAFFATLAPEAWARAGVQLDSRGRRTVDDFLSVMAWHDDNHLAQLRRALDGRA
jgi:DinB family protein